MTSLERAKTNAAAAPKTTATRTEAMHTVRPRVDVYENDDEILLVAEVPGARADDLSVQLDRNVLLLEATGTFAGSDGEIVSAEFSPVRYRRAFTIRADVDADAIRASLRDGLLELRLPRAEAAKPRRIPIEA